MRGHLQCRDTLAGNEGCPLKTGTTVLYEAYANESSQICPFLALWPEFHSNLRVILSMPRYCQSATFGRLSFCVYTLLFYGIRV